MTEEQLERLAEARIDSIDKHYLTSNMTREEYNRLIAEVEEWVQKNLPRVTNGGYIGPQ